MTEFVGFPKIVRLNREIIITEKIDGTNSQITISDDGERIVSVGSRNRHITPEDDNFGFARWVAENNDELLRLGPGRHFGEWWGSGIQRGYGLTKGEKRFSLFNVSRWDDDAARPACCHVVPTLFRGLFSTLAINAVLDTLRMKGSAAAPGFLRAEGIIVYHVAGGHLYKVTLEGDEQPKSVYERKAAA